MNFNFKTLIASGIIALCCSNAQAENVLLTTPAGFEILSLSPNGKWVCGVQRNANNPQALYAFRWNLESDVIDMLGDDTALAFDVANDGTVSGEFNDRSIFPNGAPIVMPGYWRDGSWHSVEIPDGVILTDEGIGRGISPDGHYMTGSLLINGVYKGFIWKDGKIHRELPGVPDVSSVPFAVSPDGNSATGFIEKNNRVACYWKPDGSIRYFEECVEYSSSPWHYGRRFSADGKKIVYWGGLEGNEESNEASLYCVYDTENDTVTTISGSAFNSDIEFNAISDTGSLVGQEYGRGFIWKDNKGQYVSDYFDSLGVDYGDIFFDFYQDYDYLPITTVVGISADDKVLAMRYQNTNMQDVSMVVKLDQDLNHVVPVEFSAAQLDGIKTVSLQWKKPVGAVVKGYYVYRNGEKISGFMPINRTYYYDRDLDPGTYEYQIGAVSGSNIETKCDPVTVTVKDGVADVSPYNLSARQKGVNNALIAWEAPMSRCIHKNYADPSASGLSSINIYDGIEVETAVRFPKAELDLYSGCKISEISFRPMGANLGWEVLLYAMNAETGELTTILEQEIEDDLEPCKTYTLQLDSPVDLPDSDIVVSILTLIPAEGGMPIAAVTGKSESGYSDLMRSEDEFEEDFFSISEKSKEAGSYMQLSWAIDLGLTSPDGVSASLTPASYRIYVDGQEVGNISEQEYLAKNLADGVHNIAVEAVYEDGSMSSRVQTDVQINAVYPPVTNIRVSTGEGENNRQITAEWDAPVDNDRTDIAYTDAANPANGVQSPESAGYEYMAASRYPASKFQGYEGYEISAVRFYPMTEAEYTILLVQGDDVISTMTVTDYNKNEWNEVELPEPIELISGKTYMLAIYVGSPTPATDGLGVDSYPSVEYYSDLFSLTGGQDWLSLGADAYITGNWMMGLVINDPEATELDVDGYNVIIDSKKRNDSLITDCSFDFEFDSYSTRRHNVKVETCYPGVEENVVSDVVYFWLEGAGISSAETEKFELVKGDNYLAVRGEGVEAVSVSDMSGAVVAKANGNKVLVNDLATGVYVVQIDRNGKKVVQKVMIAR